MATSETSIVNQALIRLGLKPIQNLNENNDRAIAAKAIYESTRDQVLIDGNWTFAIRRVELAVEAATPQYGYAFQHILPTDCLLVLDTDDNSMPWVIEEGRLLSNREGPKIRYVRRVTDPTKFSALFIDALAERLAAELALALKDNPRIKEQHVKLYMHKLQVARSRDSQQGTPNLVEPNLDLIAVR